MGRYIGRSIVCMVWGMVFTFIIGFIGGPLVQHTYQPAHLLLVGAIFGLLFALIIPTITAKSVKYDSEYSK